MAEPTTAELIAAYEAQRRSKSPVEKTTEQLIREYQASQSLDASKLPEPPFSLKGTYGVALARDNPVGQAGIAQNLYPGSTVDFDPSGNPVMTKDGKQYALNRPGFSGQDIANFAVDVAGLAPSTMAVSQLGKRVGLGAAGRVLGAGAGAGAGSYGLEQAGQALGSGQQTDQFRVLLDSVFGGGGEVAAPIAEKLLRRVIGSTVLVRNGELTDEGRKIIEAAGGKPDALTPETIASLRQPVDATMDAQEVVRRTRAESLPTPVKLTGGQARQNPALQTQERLAQSGAFGEDAQRLATGVFDEQSQAFRANLESVLGGRVPLKGEGAGRVGEQLKHQAAMDKAAVTAAYKDASAKGALVAGEQMRALGPNVRRSLLDNGFDVARMPETSAILDDIAKLDKGGKTTAIKLDAIENLRKRIVLAQKATMDGRDQAGLKMLKSNLDASLDDAVERGLILGDETAVESLKKARGMARDYAERFKSDKAIERIVKENLSPEETANLLFGASRIGARQGASKTLSLVKKSVSPKEWQALQEEGLFRLLVKNGELVSPAQFSTNVRRAMSEDWTLMGQLYDQNQLKLLKQMADVARDISPMPQTTNPSGSANWMIQFARKGFGLAGEVTGEVIRRLTSKGGQIVDTVRVTGPLLGEMSRRKLIPAGAVGAVAAPVGSAAAGPQTQAPRP